MRYCFDIDGTICTWVKGRDYHKAKPMKARIQKVNELYDAGNHITYFTARAMGRFSDLPHKYAQKEASLALRDLTEEQLAKWGCKYHRLLMGKPHADIFVDDKGRDSEQYFFNVREELPSAVDDAANVMSKYEVFDGTLAEDCDDFISRRSVN